MFVIGIDPGKTGGISFFRGNRCKSLYAMPSDEDLPHLIRDGIRNEMEWCREAGEEFDLMVYREDVHSMPRDGKVQAFSFGENLGLIKGVLLTLLDDPQRIVKVRPQQWQAVMRCLTGGEKSVSRARAEASFPRLKNSISASTADALLIGAYGVKMELGMDAV